MDQHKAVRLKGAQYRVCLRFVDVISCHGLFDISSFDSRGFRQIWTQYDLKKIIICYGNEGSIFAMKGTETEDG